MGELQPMRNTPPRFVVGETASPEQSSYLRTLEVRINEYPKIYEETLTKYLSFTNENRPEPERLSSIIGGVLEYALKHNNHIQALYDWYKILDDEKLNAASQLQFDEATETTIRNDSAVTRLREKLRASRGDRSKKSDKLTRDMRCERLRIFVGRVAMTSDILNHESQHSEITQVSDTAV